MNICFTGHRPSKLGGYNWNSKKNKQIMNSIRETVINIYNNMVDDETLRVKVGGALGIDQMAFAICYDLIEEGYNIELIVCVPFKDQPKMWPNKSKLLYKDQLNKADEVIYVDRLTNTKYINANNKIDIYVQNKMQLRNIYMVDDSDIVIAYWDGSKGGTDNCIKYAKSLNKKIINLYENRKE